MTISLKKTSEPHKNKECVALFIYNRPWINPIKPTVSVKLGCVWAL